MNARHRNAGLRKVCACPRRAWAKCEHPWHVNYKFDGRHYRLSLDRELGKHIQKKADAMAAADAIRVAIRAGTFRQRVEAVPVPATPDAKTFAEYADTYLTRGVKAAGKGNWKDYDSVLTRVAAFRFEDGTTLGAKALGAITEDDLEAVLADLRTRGRAVATRNRYVIVLKSAFKWAVRKGYLARSPISEDSDVKRGKPAQRSRRLQAGEEAALLKAATPRLYRLLVAALETGARRGELLKLTWQNVDLKRRELTIQAATCKTRTARVIPISDRLAAVLELAKLDPDGETFGADKFVFGDELGGEVKTFKKAWETCVLVAHRTEPAWTATNGLDAESRAAFRAIGLHFHDLRHEAGSRWLEAGWPLSHVRDMLGHASIATTSTYLNSNRTLLAASMKKLDEARALHDVAHETPGEHRTDRNDAPAQAGNSLVM